MRSVFVSPSSDDVGLPSRQLPIAAEVRILGRSLAEALQGDLHPDGRRFTWRLPPRPAAAFNAAAAGAGLLPRRPPANLIPLGYAPGQALARQADVMIHHCRHGPTLAALAAGTPALEDARYSGLTPAAGQQLAGHPGAADIIETPPQA